MNTNNNIKSFLISCGTGFEEIEASILEEINYQNQKVYLIQFSTGFQLLITKFLDIEEKEYFVTLKDLQELRSQVSTRPWIKDRELPIINKEYLEKFPNTFLLPVQFDVISLFDLSTLINKFHKPIIPISFRFFDIMMHFHKTIFKKSNFKNTPKDIDFTKLESDLILCSYGLLKRD